MIFLSDLPSGADREVVHVETGIAELIADPDVPGSWTLLLDGMPQSHVNLGDPAMIAFDYVRRIVDILDAVAPAGPLRVLHLGGGAFTLPRCLALLRPGSRQRVVEIDGPLVDLVLSRMPLGDEDIEITIADALAGLADAEPGGYDAVVADIFNGARVPAHVSTAEFARLAAAALDRGGCYIANIIDRAPMVFTRSQAAMLRTVFAEVAVMAEAPVLRGRRSGNVLLVAGDDGFDPHAVVRVAAADPFATRVEYGDRLTSFIRGRR